MKSLLFLPIIGLMYLFPIKNGEIRIETKDTVYIYTSHPPHSCKFDICDFKGQCIFVPTATNQELKRVQKIHFDHPELEFNECMKIWDKEKTIYKM